jgi:hypothetical protein
VELSEELARTCITVKRAADPREIRDQFEALAREEEGLRERAGRWENIAARRAAREEGGYASTLVGRTLGLPRSLGELLFRGGSAGLGAYAGGRVGKELGEHYARIPSGSITPLFTQAVEKGEMKPTAIQQRLFSSIEPSINTAADAVHMQVLRDAYPGLEDILKREGRSLRSFVEGINDPEAHTTQTSQHAKRIADAFRTKERARFDRLFRDMSEMDPTVVSKALSKDMLARVPRVEQAREAITSRLGEPIAKNIPGIEGSDTAALRQRLIAEFGDENMPTVRRMIRNALEEAKLPSGAGRWGQTGKWLGAGAGAVASGLPFAAYALWAKHKGGERAQIARAEARRLLGQAEGKSTAREELLKSLEAASEK